MVRINKNFIAKTNNWLVEKNIKEIHYSRLAIELGISFSSASRVCRLLAELFPEYWEYENGRLIRKGE